LQLARNHDVDTRCLDDTGGQILIEAPVDRGVKNAESQAGQVGTGALVRIM
jgi:hypothetical protein